MKELDDSKKVVDIILSTKMKNEGANHFIFCVLKLNILKHFLKNLKIKNKTDELHTWDNIFSKLKFSKNDFQNILENFKNIEEIKNENE
jgi:hypothetical protein